MKNNHIKEVRTIGNDIWEVHYVRLDKGVQIICDLMRPNRKFWQSKRLWSDWTFCSNKNANLLRTFAFDVIAQYYDIKRNEEKIDDFFKKPIDN